MVVPLFVGVTLMPRPTPATVQAQRARLPPPAKECDDPVEGIWRSHAFNEMWQEWNVFTLTVRRVKGGNELTGSVTNQAWYGPDTETARGPCEGRLQYLVSMDGKGRVVGNEIAFGGTGEWRLDQVYCSQFTGGYNLDQFKGTIDPEILEFQSVNNDGGRFVNVPTVFRRVKCLEQTDEEDEGPAVSVAPPPFYPPQEGGCSCNP